MLVAAVSIVAPSRIKGPRRGLLQIADRCPAASAGDLFASFQYVNRRWRYRMTASALPLSAGCLRNRAAPAPRPNCTVISTACCARPLYTASPHLVGRKAFRLPVQL
jgi:hypothetical protein